MSNQPAHVDDRRLDVAVAVADVPAPPVGAVVGMGQELVVPVVQALAERVRVERQLAVPARQLRERLLEDALPARVLLGTAREPREVVVSPPERPLDHESELEGAAVVDPLRPVVRRGLPHEHRAEVRRASRGQPVLGRSRVGAADGADVAVAPRLGGHPLHGVIAVAVLAPAVVVERDEAALRGEAPPNVLDHHGVALRREEGRRAHLALGGVVLAVGGPFEEGRERALALGHVDVGAEDRPVAHGLGHVTKDGELRVRAGHAWLLGEAAPGVMAVFKPRPAAAWANASVMCSSG